ncbi:MAG TPA: 3'-5' exonuclease, partial [Candidatus Binataceae bacterium]|nr:3'-5' exonuclease [Candidatus Binataceae bacterium]
RLEACVDSPDAAEVTVSTVHKAKGLEWERVAVCDDVSPFVRKAEGKPKLLFEEACVMYVALTRAKAELVLHADCMEAVDASAGLMGIMEPLPISGAAGPPPTAAPRRDSGAGRDRRGRERRRGGMQTDDGGPPVTIVYDRDQGVGTIPENLRGRANDGPRRKRRRRGHGERVRPENLP